MAVKKATKKSEEVNVEEVETVEDTTKDTTQSKILLIYSHCILSFDAASFIVVFNFLASFVPSFGINKSTNFLIGFILYNFSCHGFSVFFVSIAVEPLSFNFLVNI